MTAFNPTLDAFLPQYLDYADANLKPRTAAEYRRLLRTRIVPVFGGRRLKKLTTAVIEKWHLKERKHAKTQANRALAVLSAVLKLAARWGIIPVNPAHGISYAREAPRERYLTPAETKAMIAATASLEPQERSFVMLALLTGARPGELLAARWEWLQGDSLELPDSKTGRRTIYLSEAAQEALDTSGGRTGLIFPDIDPTTVWATNESAK